MTDLPRLTYTTAEAAEMIPCRENWLIDQLRAGRFPARKIHRQWRMTMEDIESAIRLCGYTAAPEKPQRGATLCVQSRKKESWG